MESPVKQRLISFIRYKKISLSKFEELVGLSNGYVKNMRKSLGVEKLRNMLQVFPELNQEWLLYGEGEMLKPAYGNIHQQGTINNVGDGNHFNCSQTSANDTPIRLANTDVPERMPIVPTAIARRPEFDVLPFVEQPRNDIELSSVRVDHTPITMWYRVQDRSLEPSYHKGDLLALHAYPKGHEDPIPGKLYAIDTYSNGIVVRKLIEVEGGYLAQAINRENYPDFIIKKDNIIRIYRKMLMVRF